MTETTPIMTLGQAADRDLTLRLYCRGGAGQAMKRHRPCIAAYEIDIETLIWTRGREYPLKALHRIMKCPACNSRLIQIKLFRAEEGGMYKLPWSRMISRR
jgi:hypothetical protein